MHIQAHSHKYTCASVHARAQAHKYITHLSNILLICQACGVRCILLMCVFVRACVLACARAVVHAHMCVCECVRACVCVHH